MSGFPSLRRRSLILLLPAALFSIAFLFPGYLQYRQPAIVNFIWLFSLAIFAFLAVWFVIDLLTLRRIDAVIAAAQRLETGDLSARTGLSGGIMQVERLSQAFDRMAEALARRDAERGQEREEIRKLNAELAALAAERAAKLEAVYKDMEIFSYSISHDLRAPLRAIQGFAQIIADDHRLVLNEEGRHYFDNIVQASTRMNRLIQDLLSYVRLGRRIVGLQAVRLDEVLSEVLDRLDTRVRECAATVEIKDELPVVAGDRVLLHQIFANVLDNALTYRRQEVKLTIAIGCERELDYVVVRIADNGIGMAPEYCEMVFNAFQRLHNEDQYPGTGMGLAIVKRAVEMLNGRVWMESKEKTGSVFCMKLPCTISAAAKVNEVEPCL